MSKRNIFALFLLLVCGLIYAKMNNFWRPPPIVITPAVRPINPSRLNPKVYPVAFTLDNKYELTMIKVFKKDDCETSKYPAPIWHMISDSASEPLKNFVYGMPVQNMKPSLPKDRPHPLDAKVTYRLFIETKQGRKGQVDFQTTEVPPEKRVDN